MTTRFLLFEKQKPSINIFLFFFEKGASSGRRVGLKPSGKLFKNWIEDYPKAETEFKYLYLNIKKIRYLRLKRLPVQV